jgi:hypothetical protein
VLSERRRELHKEVEVAKRNLAQQVNISSCLSFYLRMVIQSCCVLTLLHKTSSISVILLGEEREKER